MCIVLLLAALRLNSVGLCRPASIFRGKQERSEPESTRKLIPLTLSFNKRRLLLRERPLAATAGRCSRFPAGMNTVVGSGVLRPGNACGTSIQLRLALYVGCWRERSVIRVDSRCLECVSHLRVGTGPHAAGWVDSAFVCGRWGRLLKSVTVWTVPSGRGVPRIVARANCWRYDCRHDLAYSVRHLG